MKLYPHQEDVLSKTEDFNRVAYYLDMGLGKTFVGSEKMKQLKNNLNILICQKSKIDDWVEQFHNYYQDYNVINCSIAKDMKLFNKNGLELGKKYVLIINYDLIFRRPYFKKLEDFTLILDESSMIQNDKAKRSRFILKLQPKNVILLSGTPTSGKYENLWSQIKLLGWNISKSVYNNQYVNWKRIEVGGFPLQIVDKDKPYKNVDRLKDKLRQNGAVFLKTEDCFKLPEQTIIPVKIKASKEYRKFQRNSFVKIDMDSFEEIENDNDLNTTNFIQSVELIGDTTLTKRLYSRMLCGHYSKNKIKAFEDLILSTNDRLIVFYNFNDELKVLKKIVTKFERPISEVSGQVKDLSNYDAEDNSITFIQYQAGAMGLNLQKSNKIIYFTLTEKSELFEQSKKRIHRIGQSNNCLYYLMICKNSIEEDIFKTLEMRKDYTDELFKKYETR